MKNNAVVLLVSLILIGLAFVPGVFAETNGNSARLQRPERPQRPLFRDGEVIIKRKGTDRFEKIKIRTGESVDTAISRIKRRGDIEYAEPNYIATAFFVPNDPYYSYQWNFDNSVNGGIGMEEAWDVSQGSGVVVAVIDTGVAYENRGWSYKIAPDLAGTNFVAGYDFVSGDTHPNDDNGHGTHVAGTISGSTNNNIGVAGIAYNASIMPVRVLNRYGSGSYSDVAEGIRWAADNGAQVINLSLGGSASATYLEEAVKYAYEKGVTVVAAAGNSNTSSPFYPAAYDDYVISVGATRFDQNRAPYSNYGPSLDLVAPGGDLNVDQNGDGYGDGILQQTINRRPNRFGYFFYQGTSMASPHVAGVAALLMANGNALTPDEVRSALESTATDLGNLGRDDTYGWGLLSASSALGYSAGPVDNPPSVNITLPLAGSTLSGTTTISATASDDIGIDKVDFYIGGTLIDSDFSDPYSIDWNTLSVSDGNYSIKAIAYDSISQTSEDLISVSIDNINDPPTSNAGPDQSVMDADNNGSENITLDGSLSSDPDGVIASYEWSEGLTILGSATSVISSFSVGEHFISLKVTDDKGATATDEVKIDVLPYVNTPPVADAGSNIDVTDSDGDGSESVTLDGSSSYDSDGHIVSYEWKEGALFIGAGTTSVSNFSEGTHTITLTVTDDEGAISSDDVMVIVSPMPSGPVIIFFDDFESGNLNTNWTESNEFDWNIENEAERNVPGSPGNNKVAHADRCRTSSGCFLTLKDSIDLSSYSSASLKFWRYVDKSIDRNEFLKVEVYNGSSWITLYNWTHRKGDDDKWHYEEADITGYLSSDFKVRFISKESSRREETEIDDVLIEVL